MLDVISIYSTVKNTLNKIIKYDLTRVQSETRDVTRAWNALAKTEQASTVKNLSLPVCPNVHNSNVHDDYCSLEYRQTIIILIIIIIIVNVSVVVCFR